MAFTFTSPSRSPDWPRSDANMDSESPRSKVALHLRSLALDGAADGGCGGGALPGQPPHADALPAEAPRRGCEAVPEQHIDRGNFDEVMEDANITTRDQKMADRDTEGPIKTVNLPLDAQNGPWAPEDAMQPEPTAPSKPKRSTKKRAKNSTTTPKRTTKKAKKKTKKAKPPQEDPDSSDREIVDPLRASLTWQEDEITVYDPEDADDDGEGMDGVGFQPPPGAARVTAKRKLGQLAGYRRMVEKEAREGRRRRRGRGESERERITRVRFLDRETVIEVV